MSKVTISNKSNQGLCHQVQAGQHLFVCDGRKDIGGNDNDPNPHDLLLAALGSCTSMTLKLFAQRRNWDLQEVNVILDDETIEDLNNPGKKITKINRKIEVKGSLKQEELDTLKSIADKCPIHKILVDSKQILTTLESCN